MIQDPEAAWRPCHRRVTVEGIALRHLPRRDGRRTRLPVTCTRRHVSRSTVPVRRACFVGNGLRLVMPAFGAFTGGLNILDGAFEPMFGDGGMAVWMLGQEGLYPVAARLLRED